jgi:hypothetical protein
MRSNSNCKLARLRTGSLAVREAKGCVMLTRSRYAPVVFRGTRPLELAAGGEFLDLLTAQGPIAA